MHRSAGLRCGQVDQGQEAACSGRYPRPAAARPRHRRRRSPRRRPRAAGELIRPLPLPDKTVRRQRLSRAGLSRRIGWHPAPSLETEIVKRSDRAKGFVVLPKRWIVERSIASLNRCRRLAKDWENLNRNALGFRFETRLHPPHGNRGKTPGKKVHLGDSQSRLIRIHSRDGS